MAGRIVDTKLRDIGCPISLFVSITDLVGRTRLTEGLKKDNLDHGLVEKLVSLIDDMAELKRTSLIVPDWSDAEGIRAQLRAKKVMKDAAQYDLGDRERELLHGTADKTDGSTVDERHA